MNLRLCSYLEAGEIRVLFEDEKRDEIAALIGPQCITLFSSLLDYADTLVIILFFFQSLQPETN